MLILFALILFILVPVLVVWRLHRVPIRGDIQLLLMWRGAVAGSAGGLLGAALSSLVYGLKGYWPVGYLYWLIITAILGVVFTFLIGAVQLAGLALNLPARTALGALVGIVAAAAWASVIRADSGGPVDWLGRGIICMIVGGGVVSGVLGGPVRKGA